ncbi:MAG: acyltransferase [Candidatus Nanopelagicales bacterium]
MSPEEFAAASGVPQNRFHPLVFIHGEPVIGEGVYVGLFSEVNASGTTVTIGDHCDIASFVAINAADSHLKCIGVSDTIIRRPITLESHVFVGSHSVILGGTHLGHHSVVAAGSVVNGLKAPPYSLVAGNPAVVAAGYYENRLKS